jgi:prophage antirepressor-like protein
MNDIQIFNNPEFGEVRTVLIDGEPWFCGKDIAGALGYVNEKNAVKRHCDESEVSKQTLGVQTGIKKDGTPATMEVEALFVNESGLYSLIFSSKLDGAKKFKRWVTSEVLPSIRKSGTYQMESLQDNPMKLLELHYEAIKQVDKKVDNLSDRIDKIEMDLPILPIEADRITEAVRRKGVQILGGKKSEAYADRSLRQKLYNDLYSSLKHNFGVRSYKSIKRSQCDKAIEIIQRYEPPYFLEEIIDNVNRQQRFDI